MVIVAGCQSLVNYRGKTVVGLCMSNYKGRKYFDNDLLITAVHLLGDGFMSACPNYTNIAYNKA